MKENKHSLRRGNLRGADKNVSTQKKKRGGDGDRDDTTAFSLLLFFSVVPSFSLWSVL